MPTGDTSKLKRGNMDKGLERLSGESLVLSTWGGIGKEAATFYKRLAHMIASKRPNLYPAVMDGLDAGYPFAPQSCAFEETARLCNIS